MIQTIEINSIHDIHQAMMLPAPRHPLISVMRLCPTKQNNYSQEIRFINHLYCIWLKSNIKGLFKYGRESYDFQEGSLVFIKPGQTLEVEANQDYDPNLEGWGLFFHPDLIRRYPLGSSIGDYSFFDYATHEALHVSDTEKAQLNEIICNIERELEGNIDDYTQALISHNIESLLKYSQRFFDRQFITRKDYDHDTVEKFNLFLDQYFSSQAPIEKGIPSVAECGEAMHLSGKYLSDLLKKQTGHSLKDTIYLHIIDKAKTRLLNSADPVSTIAYDLGFEYPQHFSSLFKKRVGMSPSEYRMAS